MKIKLKHFKFSRLKDLLRIFFKEKYGYRKLFGYFLIMTGTSSLFSIKRNGYKLKFFPTALSVTLFQDRHSWTKEEDLLSDYLQKDDILIDIGANIGSIGIKGATLLPAGKVYMIEAHPVTYEYMLQNIRLNNLGNILPVNKALGDNVGSVRFSNTGSDDMNSVVNADEGGIIVPVDRLDNILVNEHKISFIKIDVEGYEFEVFKGSSETLAKTDCILFEAWDEHFIKYNTSTVEVMNLLKKFGFAIYGISNKKISELPANYLANQCVNLLAIKNVASFLNRTGYEIIN